MTVRAAIYPRKAVQRLGLAPMSSMYWFGENSRKRFDDLRPEVHDSDGLAIKMNTGERIWRPLSNDTGMLEFSFFEMERCGGFGLLQRDRRFNAYEDGEAAYDKRPSLWIEPTSDWGAGKVMLMEIPAHNELADNVVAMWEPAHTPQPGERLEFTYKQHWTLKEDPSGAGGRVVATRTGLHDWQPEQRTVAIEFAGGQLDKWEGDPPQAVVSAMGEAGTKIKIQGVAVQKLPEGRFRVAFQVAPAAEGGKLSEVGPQELRCCLKKGEDFLTETWAYRITP
jgi:glucans biosynthesis protein